MSSTQSDARFTIVCVYCNRHILARDSWTGRDVRCPHCSGVLRVPERGPANLPTRALHPSFGANRYFNFACGRCKSLLETHTGMCGQHGRCPTCAADFTIPHVDPASGLPDGEAQVADDGENPTPMHAYAASGGQAPQIIRGADQVARIECPRCGMLSPIDANACESCGVPFTIDAAPTVRDMDVTSRAITSLVLGVFGAASAFSGVFLICALLAIIFGISTVRSASKMSNTAMGWIAIGCAVASGGMFIYFHLL